MNPLFVNTPAQRSAVREQYLSSLQLQIENDQLNLNANKILKYTGETPTQITDTRTTEEKFADMIGTRRDVKSFLVASGYLTPFNANVYVDKASDGIIQFIYRNKQFILRDFLSKGITPIMFEDFIEAYVAKYQRNAGIEMGIQQASSGQAPIISNNQLLNRIINQSTLTDVLGFVVFVEKDGRYGVEGTQMLRETRFLVSQLRERIPSEKQMERVNNLSNASQAQVRVFLDETYKDYPAREQVEMKLGELQQARLRGDTQRVFGVLRQINALLGVGSRQQPNLEQLLRSIEGASSTVDEDGGEKKTRDG
jgi:hypothetical protein